MIYKVMHRLNELQLSSIRMQLEIYDLCTLEKELVALNASSFSKFEKV